MMITYTAYDSLEKAIMFLIEMLKLRGEML
jgi:hypothetical protein